MEDSEMWRNLLGINSRNEEGEKEEIHGGSCLHVEGGECCRPLVF